MRTSLWLLTTSCTASFVARTPLARPPSITSPRAPVALAQEKSSPAAVAGFARDRAAGLAVVGTLGFVAEATASRVPIALSPLLYATAFGIVIGNVLRLFDPEMKKMEATNVGMAFAKRRLLRAGIILYGARGRRRGPRACAPS